MNHLNLIIAQDANGGIGYNGELPWHDKEELKLFKRITMGGVLIFGRQTYESLPTPTLEGREIIVVTRSPEPYLNSPVITADSPEKALKIAYSMPGRTPFVCGGRQVYKALLPHVSTIYRSVFDDEYLCDTYMKDLDLKSFSVKNVTDYENFMFIIYERNLSHS